METWSMEHGDLETRICRDVETLRHEDIETWRLGHKDIIRKTENKSPGKFP
jgi:hypothetical protein